VFDNFQTVEELSGADPAAAAAAGCSDDVEWTGEEHVPSVTSNGVLFDALVEHEVLAYLSYVAPWIIPAVYGTVIEAPECPSGVFMRGCIPLTKAAVREAPMHVRIQWAKDMIANVATLHAVGIYHCDLKTQNFVIHPETGRLLLIDFGLAMAQGTSELWTSASADDVITWTHRSPEMCLQDWHPWKAFATAVPHHAACERPDVCISSATAPGAGTFSGMDSPNHSSPGHLLGPADVWALAICICELFTCMDFLLKPDFKSERLERNTDCLLNTLLTVFPYWDATRRMETAWSPLPDTCPADDDDGAFATSSTAPETRATAAAGSLHCRHTGHLCADNHGYYGPAQRHVRTRCEMRMQSLRVPPNKRLAARLHLASASAASCDAIWTKYATCGGPLFGLVAAAGCPVELLHLLSRMLEWEPEIRIRSEDMLRHAFMTASNDDTPSYRDVVVDLSPTMHAVHRLEEAAIADRCRRGAPAALHVHIAQSVDAMYCIASRMFVSAAAPFLVDLHNVFLHLLLNDDPTEGNAVFVRRYLTSSLLAATTVWVVCQWACVNPTAAFLIEEAGADMQAVFRLQRRLAHMTVPSLIVLSRCALTEHLVAIFMQALTSLQHHLCRITGLESSCAGHCREHPTSQLSGDSGTPWSFTHMLGRDTSASGGGSVAASASLYEAAPSARAHDDGSYAARGMLHGLRSDYSGGSSLQYMLQQQQGACVGTWSASGISVASQALQPLQRFGCKSISTVACRDILFATYFNYVAVNGDVHKRRRRDVCHEVASAAIAMIRWAVLPTGYVVHDDFVIHKIPFDYDDGEHVLPLPWLYKGECMWNAEDIISSTSICCETMDSIRKNLKHLRSAFQRA
jgi:serine/threonine protein kinase